MNLRSIRKIRGITQQEVADALGTTQSAISRMERQTDWKVSTLELYMDALGGSLVVGLDYQGTLTKMDLPAFD